MSSPDGLQYSHADFLARWMPSSHRAGVILNSSTDLAGALRHISSVDSSPMKPDDSFTSDFAPLPPSADSSCVDVTSLSGPDRPGNESQDLSLQVKLEQLKKWQQHMQEQLKAQQLEELLRLQAEQQRLLGRFNGAQQCTEDEGSSSSSHSVIPEWPPPKHRTELDADSKGEDHLDSSYDQLEDTNISRHFLQQENTSPPSNCAAMGKDRTRGDPTVSQERPIKPGIGGYTRTFEELLEEQLMLEDQRQKAAQQQQNQGEAGKAPPKRPFLKRGDGLSRFSSKGRGSFPKKDVKTDSKPQPQARVMTRSNSEPAAIQRDGVQKLPVQRKTAVLNKENRLKGLISPPLNLRNEARTSRTVLGSHQRLNTEGPGSVVASRPPTKQVQPPQVKDQTKRTGGPSPQIGRKPGPSDTKPNPVTKQVVVLGEQGSSNNGSDVETAEQRRGRADDGSVDSFELSFQEKLRQWECHRQLEHVELGEFELLEQAAEELSFSSNSSFVMKILQIDQQHKKVQAAQGLHQRRLSSTPIKSPPTKTLHRSSSDGVTPRSSSLNSEASQRSEDAGGQKDTGSEAGRKTSVSSCPESEVVNHEAVVTLFPAPSERPYNKWTYQNRDDGRDSDVSQDGDEESGSVISNPDDSTLREDEEGEQGGVVFDDDDTWNDAEETQLHVPADSGTVSPELCPTTASVSPPTQTLVRKVAVNKNVAFSNQEPNPPSPPPPPSQLMTKLFPSLNPKAQNAPLHPSPASTVITQSEKQQNENQQIQSKQLRERLVELEIEIDRFKKENAALVKLRQENEKNQESLRKERLEFEKTKSTELTKFDEYKKEETRKLRQERKQFDKHVVAARAIPDKKEREEIQALKQQLSSLQEELRRKESRWASMHNRQRQQIDSLSQENSSLREEIRVLEKLRVSTLKKTNAEKETKDSPRMFPNIPSTVTKGVKFASPLDSRGGSSNISPPQTSSGAAAICKRNTADSSQPASGMKSSLRRPSAPSILSSSSSIPGRKTEERSSSASKSLEKPPTQEQSKGCSPKADYLPSEPECSTAEEAESVQEVITFPDGKMEKVLTGGDRVIVFPNGTRKEVSSDGLSVKVTFFNGDTKQVKADQTVIYHYSEAQTTHITYPDGLEVLHFPNNQTEKHFPDGRKEITFPDQTVKNLFPDGREESVLMDGTIIQVNPDGTKEIHFNTGQKEVHTPDYKRREYPDGTVKTVYTDGRQETHYPTGRVRIKDKDGNVIMDNSM